MAYWIGSYRDLTVALCFNTPKADGITLTMPLSDGIAFMNKVLAALMTLIIIGTVVVVFGLGFMSLM